MCRFDRQRSQERSVEELRLRNGLQCARGCLRIKLGQLSTHHRADGVQKAAELLRLLRFGWPPQTVGKPLG